MKLHIIDDDEAFRDSLLWLLEAHDYEVESYDSAVRFLEKLPSQTEPTCLIVDIRMPDMSGLELFDVLLERQVHWPVIFITGHGDVPMAVQAVKRGAYDFLEKPFNQAGLLDAIEGAMAQAQQVADSEQAKEDVKKRYALLTPREQEVLNAVIAGKMNKVIADEMGISIKTVEVHRGKVMEKMQVKSVAELVQLNNKLSN